MIRPRREAIHDRTPWFPVPVAQPEKPERLYAEMNLKAGLEQLEAELRFNLRR
ncbi:hypothetical protein D3C87_2143500 [compost metagenome]